MTWRNTVVNLRRMAQVGNIAAALRLLGRPPSNNEMALDCTPFFQTYVLITHGQSAMLFAMVTPAFPIVSFLKEHGNRRIIVLSLSEDVGAAPCLERQLESQCQSS